MPAMLSRILALTCLALTAACATMERNVSATMASLEGEGASYGLLVTTLDGEEIVSINPDARFLPASNIKLATTATAMHLMGPLDAPDTDAGAAIYVLPGAENSVPSLVLVGRGDARLKDSPDCEVNCLSELADAVAAANLGKLRELMVYDGYFPDDTWPEGWSWEDLDRAYGAAASSLNINDNAITLTIEPGDTLGAPAKLSLGDADGYYSLRNEVVTIDAQFDSEIHIRREPGSLWLRATGLITTDSTARHHRIGLDDPADYTAWRLQKLLEARNVEITDGMSLWRGRFPLLDDAIPLAQLTPPPLIEDLAIINKDSQNMHAEALLRRLGRIDGSGSIEDGLEKVEAMMVTAGAPRAGYDIRDGSGMSIYNRLSPRAVVALLVWANDQEWGDAWEETFAVAGEDGTLENRFLGSPLSGKLHAKTGTLYGANGLSGYMQAASGETLAFSFFINFKYTSRSYSKKL